MTTTYPRIDELALEGLAVRAVLELVPLQARVIVRLSSGARRDLLAEQLEHLTSVDVLTAEQAQRLKAMATTDRSTDAPPASEGVGSMVMPSLSVYELLATASAPPVTDSVFDDLFDVVVTAFGAMVGEVLGGPGGALAGGLIAHGWAEEHPPSTWFE